MTNEQKVIKRARELALAWINEQRKRDGLPPLPKLERLWWSIHSKEWIPIGREHLSGAGVDARIKPDGWA